MYKCELFGRKIRHPFKISHNVFFGAKIKVKPILILEETRNLIYYTSKENIFYNDNIYLRLDLLYTSQYSILK